MYDTLNLGQISDQDFLAWGITHLAYIKAVEVNGQRGFAVHTADGQQVAILPSHEMAEIHIRRHDLEPLSVH